MIGRVLLAAVLAGIAAGIVMFAIQAWRVTPLILEAEKYETAEPAHSHDHAAPAATTTADATTQQSTAAAPQSAPAAEHSHAAGHSHDEEEWAPEDGFQRTAFTLGADIIAGVAFALIAAAAALLTGLPLTLGNGALWGLAGFAAFTLAPSAGLPPELPGMPAADLVARQVWWWATVAATAGGIGLLAMGRHWGLKLLGVAIMAVPHLIGAPQPDSHETSVPAGLANAFAANSITASAVFWMVLGVTLGALMDRTLQQPEHA